MARTDPTIYMRLPEELKDALDKAAAENKRSLTAEVVARLEQTFSTTGSDASINALALRLAETELNLHVASLEADTKLLDAHYAAESVMDVVEFNRKMGYEQPLDDQTLEDVEKIFREAQEILDDQTEEDFAHTIKELEAARDRVEALRPKKIRKRLVTDRGEASDAPELRVQLVGNVGRLDPDAKPADIVPRGQDIGSQHRPPAKVIKRTRLKK